MNPPSTTDRESQLRAACRELETQLAAGASVTAADWLARHADLAAHDECAVELIYAEFVAREQRGDAPPPDVWLERYPRYRERLERLLAIHALLHDESHDAGDSPERQPRRVGRYQIVRELGRGGMGVVYQATDTELARTVALKMILAGHHANEQQRAWLRAEAEAVARLQHPNIVQIYEVGDDGGQLFLALEFVDGGSLADRRAADLSDPRVAAQHVATLARAMHFAHARGVIHRDLKPANILLGSDGTLKISDFGLAKQLTNPPATRSGSIVGTPAYMAPEQIRGQSELVGPCSDVYGLGAILYELASGQPPFDTPNSYSTLAHAVDEAPTPLRNHNRAVPADLETIVGKCLAKLPAQRYPSALAFAEDLDRFVAGEPIRARPVGMAERLIKWARRRPAQAALAGATLFAMTALLVVSLFYNARLQHIAHQAQRLRARAEQQAALLQIRLDESQRSLYGLQLVQTAALADRDPSRGLEMLLDDESCPQSLRDFTWRYLHHKCNRLQAVLDGHAGTIHDVACSPDGRWLAVAYGTRIVSETREPAGVTIWNLSENRVVARLAETARSVHRLAFTADGNRLLLAGGYREGGRTVGQAWLIDVTTGENLVRYDDLSGVVWAAAISPDQRAVALADGGNRVRLWDLASGAVSRTLGETASWRHAAFLPDGRLATGSGQSPDVEIWHTEQSTRDQHIDGPTANVSALAVSPDGTQLATAHLDRIVRLWRVDDGALHGVLKGHNNRVTALAFSPDGSRLASGSDDYTIKVWTAADGTLETSIKAHDKFISAVAWSADGRCLVSGSADRSARVWKLAPAELPTLADPQGQRVLAAQFAPSGEVVALAGLNRDVSLHDRHGVLLHTAAGHDGCVRALAFSSDSHQLFTASEDRSLGIWLVHPGPTVLKHRMAHGHLVTCVAVSADDRLVATGSLDGMIQLWQTGDGAPVHAIGPLEHRPNAVCFSPDGRRLLAADEGGHLLAWNLDDWQALPPQRAHVDGAETLAFSPDGQTLATGGHDRTVRLWNAHSLEPRALLTGHTHWINSLAFSPDGRTLASGTGDRWPNVPGEVKLWDAASGHLRATFVGHSSPVAFSPDGTQLIMGGNGDQLTVLHAP